MKTRTLFLLSVLVIASIAPTATAQEKAKLQTYSDSISYAMAASYATQFQNVLGDSTATYLNPDMYYRGLVETLAGESQIDSEAQKALQLKFQSTMQRIKQSTLETVGLENKKVGEDFLKANAEKEGVTTTASGLQYKVLKEGTGAIPTASNKVKVHYEGRLIDGTVFDSSYDRGEPAVFGVTQVIKGWTEVLQLMKEGAKYQVYIPSELAYGTQARGEFIRANETLVFDVELISIQ